MKNTEYLNNHEEQKYLSVSQIRRGAEFSQQAVPVTKLLQRYKDL